MSQTASTPPTLPTPPDESVHPIDFAEVSDARSFSAKYAIIAGDLVFHFFPPQRATSPEFWTRIFPAGLEEAAREVFRAEAPRLAAQHVSEPAWGLDSWWLRALGFGRVPDPDGLARLFVARLDETLAPGEPPVSLRAATE